MEIRVKSEDGLLKVQVEQQHHKINYTAMSATSETMEASDAIVDFRLAV